MDSIAYKVCRWFWELGQIKTLSNGLDEGRKIARQMFIDNFKAQEIFSGLVLK